MKKRAHVPSPACGRRDDQTEARGTKDKADDKDADEEARQAKQPTYVAHIALATTGILTENGFSRLEPGMAVMAEIKTGRRTVISYLLSPLSRFRQEGLREG